MTTHIIFDPGYFPDFHSGRALALAQIYIGDPDTDPEVVGNQKTVSALQEDTTTVPITQPIATSAGGVPIYNGSPVTLYVDGHYSMKVLDSAGDQVYYVPNSSNISIGTDVGDVVELVDDGSGNGVFPYGVLPARVFTYNTVADMAAGPLSIGDNAATVGYYAAGDGGGAAYNIVASGTGTDDGGSYIDLDNGSQAELIPDVAISISQFGAKGDGSTDDADAINAAIDFVVTLGGGEVVFPVPSVSWLTASTITSAQGITLRFLGAGTRDSHVNFLAPTSAVTGAAIRMYELKGVGLVNAGVDMAAQPDGAIGIEIRAVWYLNAQNCHVFNCDQTNSFGWKAWTDPTDSHGTYWDTYINCSSEGSAGTLWQFQGQLTGTRRLTTQTLINAATKGGDAGFEFNRTGSGMTAVTLNAESATGDAVSVNDAAAGTSLTIVGGEISSNVGWGITGDSDVLALNMVFANNTSGNADDNVIWQRNNRIQTDTALSFWKSDYYQHDRKEQITMVATDSITPDKSVVRVEGGVAAITLTSDPQVDNPVDDSAQFLTIIGGDATNTVTLVDGQGLRLDGNAVLALASAITLVYDASFGDWVEISRSIK